MSFPHPLTHTELEFIRWLLPEHSQVYTHILKHIESAAVIGEGRWDVGDLLIGNNSSIDLTLGMTPVVAYGECIIGDEKLTISIHEPNIDEQIEVHFSMYPLPDNPQVISGWTYSYWLPGMPSPESGSAVREVVFHTEDGLSKYSVIFSPALRAIWLHYGETRFNELLPVTGFMDELLRTHGIRDLEKITRPQAMFDILGDFSDDDIRRAFWEYSQISSRKFDMSGIVIEESKPKKSLLKKLLKK